MAREGGPAAGQLAKVAQKRPLTPAEEHRLMAALQAARMACDAAGLVDGDTEGSPKLTELAAVLEELCVDGGRKAVVFSQWERMTRMAEEVARKLGLGVVRLHGGVPSARRGDLIGRVHRLGQRNSGQVVLIVAVDSYEERIERVVAAGGGLVVVAEEVDPAIEALVAQLAGEVPLAVVDCRSWASLSRLGAASPVSGGRVLLEGSRALPAEDGIAILKLKAAEALAEAGHPGEALSLATTAMLHAVSGVAGRPPPPPEGAAVWLYGELVPGRLIRPDQAATISRALALAAAREVPRELVREVLDDAQKLVGELAEPTPEVDSMEGPLPHAGAGRAG